MDSKKVYKLTGPEGSEELWLFSSLEGEQFVSYFSQGDFWNILSAKIISKIKALTWR